MGRSPLHIGHMPEPGDVIGYRRDGRAIYLAGGGARQSFDTWVPEEYGSDVIQRVNQMSAIEALARREPMGTDTRHVPRSGGASVAAVAKGASYAEDTATNDDVLLSAVKFGTAIRIAAEELVDAPENIIAVKQRDWATSYAKYLDNACLATSGASNGGTIPFTSLYKALRTTDSATSYTADANYFSTSAAAPTYTELSNVVGAVETGDYWDDGSMRVIAHPAWRNNLRGILDSQNRPIFIQTTDATPDTLFGLPVRWSLGAKTHPGGTATSSPTGKPLLFVVNLQLLILGIRSGPESAMAGADTGAAFLTDEALLKMRSRRGWAVGHEGAAAVLEDTR